RRSTSRRWCRRKRKRWWQSWRWQSWRRTGRRRTMTLSPACFRKARGMALLLVLVAVMALAIIVAGLYESSQASWDESSLSRARYQAGLLAESGLTIALHPDIEPGDVAL